MIDPKNWAWKVTPSPLNDETFIKDMVEVIEKITAKHPSMTLILIGHSFGGDALLQVAKRIEGRKIAFLAVLDGVGKGGLRSNITKPVPENVGYFFNRWQQNPAFSGADKAFGDHFFPLIGIICREK
jgi:thioesterase domain-containing protein